MTTPYLDEAERCNRVAMMNEGRIISLDTPKNVKASIEKEVIEMVCSDNKNAHEILKENKDYDVQIFGDRINVGVESYATDYPAIELILHQANVNIKSHKIITPSLEFVFIDLIKNAS